jgi:F0F1-type ATP synthase gamma subunit
VVSSSKLRRAEKNTKQFEPYMEKMQDAITAIAGASKNSSLFVCFSLMSLTSRLSTFEL